MSTRLIQIVAFVNVAPAASVALPHNLNINDVQKRPDFVAVDQVGFAVVVTATTVTVTNNNAIPVTANVWLELKHSIPRMLGGGVPNLTPQPFIASGGGAAGGSDLSVDATFFDDFVSLANWKVTLNGGGTSGSLTLPEPNTCGLAAVAGNVAGQFASIDLTFNWFEIETFPILVKTRANHSTVITAALDVRLELGLIKSGGGVLGDGAYFRCGNAQNGNNNWNAFRTGAPAVDTGIPVNTIYRDFEIEFDGVNWLYRINGVLVATIAAQGATTTSLGFNRFQVSGLASSIINVDYFAYRYDLPR